MTKGVGEGRRGYWDRQLAAAHRTSGGCLEWAGYRSSAGYGKFGRQYAHRVSWIEENGPVPDGCDVHHRCKNRACIEPIHLEALPRAEHLETDETPVMLQKKWTECPRGHEFTDENTHIYPSGKRACKRCIRARRQKVAA